MHELEPFRRFASAVSIVHHIPGRIRMKLEAIEIGEGERAGLAEARGFQHVLDRLPGVRSLRVNLLARSCIVEYDKEIISPDAWGDLLGGERSAAADRLWRLIAVHYAEFRDARA